MTTHSKSLEIEGVQVNIEWGNNAEAERSEGIEKIVFNLGDTTIVII